METSPPRPPPKRHSAKKADRMPDLSGSTIEAKCFKSISQG